MTYPQEQPEPPIDPWLTTNHFPPVPPPSAPPFTPQGTPPPTSHLPRPAPPQFTGAPVLMPVVVQKPPTTGLATASLTLGILGVVFGCCTFGAFSLAGVICGHLALREINRTGVGGRTSAVWGLLLSYPMVVLGVIGTLGAITDWY